MVLLHASTEKLRAGFIPLRAVCFDVTVLPHFGIGAIPPVDILHIPITPKFPLNVLMASMRDKSVV